MNAKRFSILILLVAATLAFRPLKAQAQEADVLGAAPGSYEAEGELVSRTAYLPKIHYRAERKLHDGIIEATTHAYILGFEVATVSARLGVKPTGPGEFELIDLGESDAGPRAEPAIAGHGSCVGQSCTFSATVMNGALTLNETWQPTPDGFKAVHCSQIFQGQESTYQAQFHSLASSGT